MRRIRAALVALLASALLAGCVAIPTGGAVSRFALRGGDDAPTFNFLARPPAEGDDQDEILAGFIQAGIDTQDRYAVARQYLTTDLAARWNPNSSVTVTDGTRSASTRVDGARISLTVRASARVDASGAYSTTSDTAVLPFSFVKQKGEWRISAAPDGTVLSPYNFSAVFAAFPLYFLDPTGAFLVPDLRWYPAGASAQDRVVRGLLAGPATWLGSGAVVSAFPRGTQLGSDGVDIRDGVATVDLSAQVLEESAAARRRMTAQLQTTLQSITTLSAVRLAVRGVAIEVPADSSMPTDDPQVGTEVIAFGQGGLGTVSGQSLAPLPPFTAKTAELPAGPATLDRSRSTLALRSSQGVWRIPAAGQAELVDRRSALIAPAIDPEGFVWTAQTSGVGTVAAIDPRGGVVRPIGSASTPSGGVLVSMRMSRDGTRIAFGVITADGPVLQLGAIQRDSSLVPTGLGPFLTIPVTGGTLVDVAWIDPQSVAYLVRDASGTTVRSQQVGGQSASLGRPVDAAQIVGGNAGVDGLRILTSEGGLLQQTGAGGWQTTGTGSLSWLVTQQ
ncbi:MAG: GerMN domain-containing protein [Micrococcales bacterium]|nr:GerMN domain-containing protein [Micrococcales bacterium]